MSAIEQLNAMPPDEAAARLAMCCGASRWVAALVDARPFVDAEDLFAMAERTWATMGEADWLEAFRHHPQIGDRESLRRKFASTATWASREQSGTATASDATLSALAEGNQLYEAKNGFIFIVCATGKGADEMLALLQARLRHDRETELRIAAGEQGKIARIRLEKLLQS